MNATKNRPLNMMALREVEKMKKVEGGFV